MSIRTAVFAGLALAMPLGAALASQGPGVGQGTASPQLQTIAAVVIGSMAAAIVVAGPILLALGSRSRE